MEKENNSLKLKIEETKAKQEEEKLELLKRAEVRTMKKDIKELRDVEVEKERQRIIDIESKKKLKVQPSKETVQPAEKQGFIPKPPKKPSPLRKTLVRIGFVLIAIFSAGFLYWFFTYGRVDLTNVFSPEPEVIPEQQPSILDKIGQLFIVGFKGSTITPELEEFFKKYKPGGILLLSENIKNEDQLKDLIEGLQNISLRETGLPLLVAVDQEGKPVSRIDFLQEKTAQSEITNATSSFDIGLMRGQELKKLGVNLNLAPVLDDAKQGDFLFDRCFQKTPELAGELAKSLISGQKLAGILTGIKHFPGYVNIDFNPEDKLALSPLPEISQFQKAMAADPELVMVTNAVYQEIDPFLPFSFSNTCIGFLKASLGSDIVIISDDLSQNSLLDNFSLKNILISPLKAGVDILIFSGWRSPVEQAMDVFLEAVENKEISETRINDILSKIVKLKQNL